MQMRSTGYRTRERSSSVVLLGKLSAIVRRGSVFQADLEDAHRSSNNNNSSSNNEEERKLGVEDEMKEVADFTRRCSIGAIPTAAQSNLTACDTLGGGSCQKGIQRLQFYPVQPFGLALAKPLSCKELLRRTKLEGQIGDFSALHGSFAPPAMIPNDQEKKAKLIKVAEASNYEFDNNEQDIIEDKKRCVACSLEEDVAVKDGSGSSSIEDDEYDAVTNSDGFEHSEELDFDPMHMRMSVLTLMNRIKSESLVDKLDMHCERAGKEMSNQDDDFYENHDSDDAEDDVDKSHRINELDLENNDDDDKTRSNRKEDLTELAQAKSPTKYRLQKHERNHPLNCGDEDEVLSAQDQLTSSMRRLVIELKDDSDQMRNPLAQSHEYRRKSIHNPLRKRAGSCPSASDLSSPSPHDEGSSMLTPIGVETALFPEETSLGKKHKKSAFSRIGPRMLETLHLRKKRKTYLFTDEELETIEGARWKIVELAFRFGGKHRSYLVQAINMFFPMLKYGRRGGAHATRLHCNCCGTLQWQHKRGGLSEAVDLAEVLQVIDGRHTAVFRKYPFTNLLEACSFSVVFRDRTLDLETQSLSHRDWLVSALRTLVAYARRQRCIEHQAIAERAMSPLEECVLQPPVPLVQSPS